MDTRGCPHLHCLGRDALGAIAVCYGTTRQHLVYVNSISNPNLIKVCQVLKV